MANARGERTFRAWQEAKHDEAEPEIIRLGQRVQTTERIGKAQQADGARKEEEDAGADRGDAEEVNDETDRRSATSGASAGATLLTKAAEAKAASSASPRATSSTPCAPVATAIRRSEADFPGADELRRHQAIGVAWAAQDAHEPDSDGEEDRARSREKELSHRRTPG